MTKIAFIGAGSLTFTRKLVRDILTYPLLKDATITLMDIDAERLDFALKSVKRIVQAGSYPARVEATMDRAEALKGADAVLCSILVGDTYQRRRYAWAFRHFPRTAHHPSDAPHHQGRGALLPGCHLPELHQSNGHVMPGAAT